MARPGLEPGTPRSSVVPPSLLSLTHLQGFSSISGGRRRRCFAALCGRLRCDTAHGGVRGPFRRTALLQARHIVGAAAAVDCWAPLQPTAGEGRHKRFGSFESCALTSRGIWTFRGLGRRARLRRARRLAARRRLRPGGSAAGCRRPARAGDAGLTGRPHCVRRRSRCDRGGPADTLRRVVAGAVSSD
jgi:hypothetical protein